MTDTLVRQPTWVAKSWGGFKQSHLLPSPSGWYVSDPIRDEHEWDSTWRQTFQREGVLILHRFCHDGGRLTLMSACCGATLQFMPEQIAAGCMTCSEAVPVVLVERATVVTDEHGLYFGDCGTVVDVWLSLLQPDPLAAVLARAELEQDIRAGFLFATGEY